MVAVDVSSRGVQTSSPFVHANISLYDKEVFKAIRSLQQEYGADQGFTFNQIALRADVSRGTAVRSVGHLERAGWIQRSNKGGGREANQYCCNNMGDAAADVYAFAVSVRG